MSMEVDDGYGMVYGTSSLSSDLVLLVTVILLPNPKRLGLGLGLGFYAGLEFVIHNGLLENAKALTPPKNDDILCCIVLYSFL